MHTSQAEQIIVHTNNESDKIKLNLIWFQALASETIIIMSLCLKLFDENIFIVKLYKTSSFKLHQF